MLKGAKLCNTDWILGITVFTGLDTKIARNSSGSIYKMSNIEVIVNKIMVQLILL